MRFVHFLRIPQIPCVVTFVGVVIGVYIWPLNTFAWFELFYGLAMDYKHTKVQEELGGNFLPGDSTCKLISG